MADSGTRTNTSFRAQGRSKKPGPPGTTKDVENVECRYKIQLQSKSSTNTSTSTYMSDFNRVCID